MKALHYPRNRGNFTLNQGPTMRVNWGPGLHVAVEQRVNSSAYDQYVGRWSRLFVSAVLDAAEVAVGDRVLDVATGPGEAAAMALPRVGPSGLVVGADISAAMLDTASARFAGQRFRPVAMDGQSLAFADASFDSVICQLGRILGAAGFCDVSVKRETREGVIESFDDYWNPIEEGVGSLPQAYRALPEATRLAVRHEVKAGLSQFETDGRLAMSVEMLIGAGRA